MSYRIVIVSLLTISSKRGRFIASSLDCPYSNANGILVHIAVQPAAAADNVTSTAQA